MCQDDFTNAVELDSDKVMLEVGPRLGRIALKGRYHIAPRKLDDDYTVNSQVLGKGCSGNVLAITSVCDKKRKFALKSFKLDQLGEVESRRAKGELSTLLCMDHPHVARLVDVYENDSQVDLVMECMEGGELFDRLHQNKKFSEPQAANAMGQILMSLNYIHARGIVHRDLKLENFMYSTKGGSHLKLIDFGFSKFFGGRLKSTCGTLSYVAPEVLKMNYGSQCDLWSAGVIAFILLSGCMPFYGNKDEKIQQIKTGEVPMPDSLFKTISDEAKAFTRGLLHKDPDARLTAKNALAHAWIEKHNATVSRVITEPSYVGNALTSWKSAPKLRRACLTLMAWNLPDSERSKYSDSFLALDTDHNGLISFSELKKLMVGKCKVRESQFKPIFESLDSNQDEEVHYSEFVAAMISEHMDEIDASLLQITFRQFDKSLNGSITPEDFKDIVGAKYDGTDSQHILLEADTSKDGRVDYGEFEKYISMSTSRKLSSADTASASPKSPKSPHNPKSQTSTSNKASPRMKVQAASVDAPKQGCCTLM